MLNGKVVIVTGAGRGIGAAIARVCAKHGASVAINYAVSRDKAEAVAADIRATGGTARTYAADVRDATAVNAMVAQVHADFGRIDGVVNNAIAGRQHGSLDVATDADYDTAFAFGCRAVINTTKAVRPIFKAQGGGRIVNIVTELWNVAPENWSVYMAGKGAMIGVSRSLARELGPEQITVNMVAPGWMIDEKVDLTADGPQGYAKSTPLRRQGSADEIGNGCVYFLSELAGFVTGAYLPVTGGRVAQVGT
ncbi:MAG TPA: SDR family oxidoreductase [Tepidisphaeraceae bacterium]|jgi:3-oxoacyl-[acyl-carrier protein] reductase|nr:SDR family oxidoreductase [Tepidisphaeraceae bacterium]